MNTSAYKVYEKILKYDNLVSKENIYKTDLGKKSLDYVLKHYSKSIAIKKWRNLYTN